MPISTHVYALVDGGLSEDQGRVLNDAVLGAGGRLAVLVSPEILVLEGGDDLVETLSGLDGVRAVGHDDLTPLLAAAAFGSPGLLAQLTALAATTSAATAAAEALRPHQEETWTGFCDTVGGE